MEYSENIKGLVVNIKMSGKFTFSDHNNFKSIFEHFDNSSIELINIDIEDIDFIDSAALGLLLLARDKAAKKSKKVKIVNANGQVDQMFELSRFYELFDITKLKDCV